MIQIEEEFNIEEELDEQRFIQPSQILALDKDQISKMKCNLTNLIEILKRIRQYIIDEVPKLQNGDLIVTIGNTGCGKSTLLSSLIYGAESLHEVKIDDHERRGKNKHKVVIDQKEQLGIFDIGHSKHQSKTFLPHFINDDLKGVVYADIAGLQDTGGPLIEFTNCFLNKILFQMVKRIKILVPITIDQISQGRGQEARKQLQVIQKLINSTDPNISQSILPIITKCKPNDEDLDLDLLRHIFLT